MAGIVDFKNKVVVVTGAGSGIGRSIAHLFSEKQAILIIADKDENRLKQVEGELETYGVRVISKVVDVSDLKQVKSFAEFAVANCAKVDILINNAGIGWGGPSDIFPLEDFEKVMAVNFWGVIYGVQCFLPVMQNQEGGHIVNISSLAGLCGVVGLGAYTASKHAVAGYSEVLRAELRRFNIGVTTICPGVINTKIVEDGKATLAEGMKIDQSKMIAFYKKWGWPPERVAKAVLKAVQKNKGVVPVGPEAWIFWYIKRFSQRLWASYLRLSVKIGF
jgi:NAD(P)-dependent dehydrogenase (short-subunit alcohol dehydrogenase family)